LLHTSIAAVPGLVIRTASSSDATALYGLIRELAEYEELLETMTSTVESIQQALCGPAPAIEAIVAEFNSELVGCAIFFSHYSTFVGRQGLYLEDIYVQPALRGQGIGRLLFLAVAHEGHNRNAGRIEWQALNWNETAIHFYEALGARRMSEWITFRLESPQIQQLASEFSTTGTV
jgi:GNAT superfamily N-acetyltransferase